MIKKFNEYINEDYFSKLANRKDNGNVRKENDINENIVREYIEEGFDCYIISITIRKENGKQIVDIDGNFYLTQDVEEIPFQFGTITGDFNCSYCKKLTSLEGFPQEVEGDFYCHCCRPFMKDEQFTKNEIRKICNVKGKIIL